jgi:hypothetical protein
MKRKLTVAGIVIGAVLTLGPLWGMIGTILAIQRSYTVLARSADGYPSAVLWRASAANYLRVGLIVCPFGIALFIFSINKLLALRRRLPPLPSS